ncbi:hypothetical protein GGD62_008086 [Bradyrhizobium sp. ERR14]|nr:hypothetical protein [Bradyrhizobium sp. ERR14]
MGHRYIRPNGLFRGLSPGPAAARKCSLREGAKVCAHQLDHLAGEMTEISIALESVAPGPIYVNRALIKRAVWASNARRGDSKW